MESGFGKALSKKAIFVAVPALLCIQLFYVPSYWLFTGLIALSLLEGQIRVRRVLVASVLCAYVVMSVTLIWLARSHSVGVASSELGPLYLDSLRGERSRKLDNVIVFKISSEKHRKFAALVEKLRRTYNAIVFSCKIDEELLNLFLTQVAEPNCFRTITGEQTNPQVLRKDIVLTYINVGKNQRFFRLSHKKEYAVLLQDTENSIDTAVFSNLWCGKETGGVYLNFIKFYPEARWTWLKSRIAKGRQCGRGTMDVIRGMESKKLVELCDALEIDLTSYLDFEYVFVTPDELGKHTHATQAILLPA